VRDHRRPPRALAEITIINPPRTKWFSVATIRSTPAEMRRITPTSRTEKVSRRKKKAKPKTNTREEDLHMAVNDVGGELVSTTDEDAVCGYMHMEEYLL
jgi:hypothetical protein